MRGKFIPRQDSAGQLVVYFRVAAPTHTSQRGMWLRAGGGKSMAGQRMTSGRRHWLRDVARGRPIEGCSGEGPRDVTAAAG